MNGRAKTNRIGTRLPNTNQDSAGTTTTCTFTTTLAIPAPIIRIDCDHNAKSSPSNRPPSTCRTTARRLGLPTRRYSRHANHNSGGRARKQRKKTAVEGPTSANLMRSELIEIAAAPPTTSSRGSMRPRGVRVGVDVCAVAEVSVVTRQCSCR